MTPDECRQKAEDCRVQASKALSSGEKAAWLTLADEWLRLSKILDSREDKSGP